MSSSDLQEALNKWQIEELPEGYYRFCNTDDKTLGKIFHAVGLDVEPRLYNREGIRRMKSKLAVLA